MDPRRVNFLSKDEESGLITFDSADGDTHRAALTRASSSTGISAGFGLAAGGINNLRTMSQVSYTDLGSSSAGATALGKVVAGIPITANQAHSIEWQQFTAQQRESVLQTHQQTMQEQQVADVGMSNVTGRRPTVPAQGGISFAAVFPTLLRELPPDKRPQLHNLYQKYKKGEIGREDMMRCLKVIAGDKLLGQAVATSIQEHQRLLAHQAYRMMQKQNQQEPEHQLQQKNQIELQKVQEEAQVKPQEQHQQSKTQIELQPSQSQMKPLQEKQSPFYSQDAEEEVDTESSSDSDLQSTSTTTIAQQQTPQIDPKQQLHLQSASNFSDVLIKSNLSLSKIRPGEQLLECGQLHLNPTIPASLQQVKHEVDRSLASMQLTFQHQQRQQQLSPHELQSPAAGFPPPSSLIGKLSGQSQPQGPLPMQQPAEAQGKLLMQPSQLVQPRVLDAESVQTLDKPLSKYAKQKIRREQKKREDEERLRKIQDSERLKKMLNASNQQGAEQQPQHQQPLKQPAQPEGCSIVSNSERTNAPIIPYPYVVKQESYEQSTSQLQTAQSSHFLPHEKDVLEKKLSEKSDDQPQAEVEQSPASISGTEATTLPITPGSAQTILVSGSNLHSVDAHTSEASSGQVRPPSSMPGSLIQQIMAFQTKSAPKKTVVAQKKPADVAPVGQPPSKKMKASGNDAEQSFDQLNDVTIVSGVNLKEEEEQLLVGPKEESRTTEAMRKFALEEENRLFLEKAYLHAKVSSIATNHGISISDDVERCLSMSVEERLWGIIHRLAKISKQRYDMEREKHTIVRTSDSQMQVMMIKKKAKEELDRKQFEEAERLRKLNEEKQSLTDAGKEAATKTQKEQQQEEDKLRTDAANLVARAAVGVDDMLTKWQMMAEQGRQKRQVDSGAGTADSTSGTKPQDRSSVVENKGLSLSGSRVETNIKKLSPVVPNGTAADSCKADAMSSRPEKVPPKITVKDVISFLELEPQMAKSVFLYRLYERERKTISNEEAIPK